MLARSPLAASSSLFRQGLLVRAQGPLLFTRPLSTATTITVQRRLTEPVPLSFTKIPAPAPQDKARSQPIVVLHGLFGSKQNWNALSKAMASRLNTQVFALDLRNHGESGHSVEHDYTHMANDVIQFLEDQHLEKPIVIGHSMGGKVAMNMALLHAPLDRVIVVDMAPVKVKLSSDFARYVVNMKEIHLANVKKQSDADAIMQKAVPELGVRQFLLTNLKRNASGDGYSFRIPLETLGGSLEKLGQFDFVAGQDRYDGKALFIKGNRSGYVKDKEEKLIKEFFPQARIEGLDTGHWVHAQKPEEFLQLVTDFAVEE